MAATQASIIEELLRRKWAPPGRLDTDTGGGGTYPSMMGQLNIDTARNLEAQNKAQSWLENNSPNAQDTMAKEQGNLQRQQNLTPGYGETAPKGVIGSMFRQVLGGLGEGAAQGAGNLVKGLISGESGTDNKQILESVLAEQDPKKAAILLMGSSDPRLQGAGSPMLQDSFKGQEPDNKLYLGGAKDNPLQRQYYDRQGNALNIPPYTAFQERQAPVTYGEPVVTTEDSHPNYNPGTVLQTDSRGQAHVVHAAPAKMEVKRDPTTGAIIQKDTQTGKLTIDDATDAQADANANLTRSSGINAQFNDLIQRGFDPTAVSTGSAKSKLFEGLANSENTALSTVGSMFMEPNDRDYKGIRDAWNEVNLRDESGATINRSEWASKDRINWPMPGDSQRDVERKARFRAALERGVAGKTKVNVDNTWSGSSGQMGQTATPTPQTFNGKPMLTLEEIRARKRALGAK